MIENINSNMLLFKVSKQQGYSINSYTSTSEPISRVDNIFIKLSNLYNNNLKTLYGHIKNSSKYKTEIIDIFNSLIYQYILIESYEKCEEIVIMRDSIKEKLDTIFN